MVTQVHKLNMASWLALTIGLAGCSTYSETFQCAPGQGVGCHSISYVDGMVDQGQLPLNGEEGRAENTSDLHQAEFIVPTKKLPDYPVTIGKTSSEAIVLPGRYLRIWMAGHGDGQGNYHLPSYVYSVLEPGRWYFREVQ